MKKTLLPTNSKLFWGYVRSKLKTKSAIGQLPVKGITSTSYFSVHFKNTIFWMMEGKFLCSGDSLGLADVSDKAN